MYFIYLSKFQSDDFRRSEQLLKQESSKRFKHGYDGVDFP